MEAQEVRDDEIVSPVDDVRPPEEFVALPKPEEIKPPSQTDILKASYPTGTRLFWYQPEGGGDQIPLPLDMKNPPDKLFFWELHQIKNVWVQMASYMDRFDVPKPVQRYVYGKLSDNQLTAMCNKWFEQMGGGATAGE